MINTVSKIDSKLEFKIHVSILLIPIFIGYLLLNIIVIEKSYLEERQRIVRGETNDRLAYYFGGVGGQGGLFSVASDIVKFMKFMLRRGKTEEGKQILPA